MTLETNRVAKRPCPPLLRFCLLRFGSWVEERHDNLAVIFPEVDSEKLDGSILELTEQGLAMKRLA